MNAINNNISRPAGTTSTPDPGVLSTQGGKFGDNQFLQILVTQLRTQTPLEPVDNTSFMNQMASFSTMEEQKKLNENILQLLNFQGALAKIQGLSEGSNLLGKQITFDPGDGTAESGLAESVSVNSQGEVEIMIDGQKIGLQQIIGVAQSSTTP